MYDERLIICIVGPLIALGYYISYQSHREAYKLFCSGVLIGMTLMGLGVILL